MPGAKFSMSTSAVSTKSSSAWRPASVFRSSTTLRLLELSITNSWDSTRLVGAEAQLLTAGRLDLDDVGAQLCEQQPAVRAVVDLAEFEDPDTVKGRHNLHLSFFAAARDPAVTRTGGAPDRNRGARG